MSRWYQPRRFLSNAKKVELKAMLEADEAFRLESGRRRLLLDEHRRADEALAKGLDMELTRDEIALRFGLSKFSIALAERRLSGAID